MKEGYKTSEFWIALVAMVMSGGMGFDATLVSDSAGWISGMIASAYALGRSWIKAMEAR